MTYSVSTEISTSQGGGDVEGDSGWCPALSTKDTAMQPQAERSGVAAVHAIVQPPNHGPRDREAAAAPWLKCSRIASTREIKTHASAHARRRVLQFGGSSDFGFFPNKTKTGVLH